MTGKIIQLINGCFMFEVSGNDGKNKEHFYYTDATAWMP
jgi:hypothetical protein